MCLCVCVCVLGLDLGAVEGLCVLLCACVRSAIFLVRHHPLSLSTLIKAQLIRWLDSVNERLSKAEVWRKGEDEKEKNLEKGGVFARRMKYPHVQLLANESDSRSCALRAKKTDSALYGPCKCDAL